MSERKKQKHYKPEYFRGEKAMQKLAYKRQKQRTLFDEFASGKYKGFKLLTVLTTDVEYFIWAVGNHQIKLTKKANDFYKLFCAKHKTEIEARVTKNRQCYNTTKKVASV